MKPLIAHSLQRMVIVSAALVILALLIAVSFDDGRMGWIFLLGCSFGIPATAVVQWFGYRNGWFR